MQGLSSTPWFAYRRRTSAIALRAIYHADVALGLARGRDGVLPSAIEPTLRSTSRLLSNRLRNGRLRFTSYRQKLLSKGAGKYPRVISIATARDRIALKALTSFLTDVFPEAKTRTAQEKVDLLKVQLALGAFDSFVRVDIENFYPSVAHAPLFAALGTRIRKPEPLAVLKTAVTTPTCADGRPTGAPSAVGVPQGLAISNALAEIAMISLDSVFSGRHDIHYTRYVDDIFVLCDSSQVDGVFDDLRRECLLAGLKVHEITGPSSKSAKGLVSTPFSYLGYQFENGKVGVREESIKRMQASIARVLTTFKRQRVSSKAKAERKQLLEECRWKLNLIITGCTFRQTRRGWVAYFSQLTDLSVLKRLDIAVSRDLARFGLSTRLKPKSFVRTYWRIRHPGGKDVRYIPNFDKYSSSEKRDLLIRVFGIQEAKSFTQPQLDKAFDTRVRRLVKDLEQHIGALS